MILLYRVLFVIVILFATQHDIRVFGAMSDGQDQEALMRNIASHREDINFSEEDFLDGRTLCIAIERELRGAPQVDDQQNDEHKKFKNIARELKTVLDRHSKKLTDVTDWRYQSMSVLGCAIYRRKIDVVRVLLNFPDAKQVQELIHSPDDDGFTPLHCAAVEGCIEIAHMLLLKSNNRYQLLVADTHDNWGAEYIAYKWCKYKTGAFLGAAFKAHEQGGDQGLRLFLENYELVVSQEEACSCCTIL